MGKDSEKYEIIENKDDNEEEINIILNSKRKISKIANKKRN